MESGSYKSGLKYTDKKVALLVRVGSADFLSEIMFGKKDSVDSYVTSHNIHLSISKDIYILLFFRDLCGHGFSPIII